MAVAVFLFVYKNQLAGLHIIQVILTRVVVVATVIVAVGAVVRTVVVVRTTGGVEVAVAVLYTVCQSAYWQH